MGLGKTELHFTAWNPREIQPPVSPRWIVLGKSNVGKSSFLNALVHPHKVFKVGSKPGVTTGIIAAHVQLGKTKQSCLEIVDTPGYGFTVRRQTDKERWGELLDTLAQQKQSAKFPSFWLWLIDPLTDYDQEEEKLLDWLRSQDFVVVFTKCDRIKASMRNDVLKRWSHLLSCSPRDPFWVSAQKGEGFEEVFRFARHYVKGI
jgi:GTP-binding protein